MATPATIRFAELNTKPSAPPANYLLLYSKTDNILYVQNSSGVEVPLDAGAILSLTGDVTATGPGAAATTVVSVGGKTASQIATSVNDTLAATALNTFSTIVKRDSSGNFAATTITANLLGNATNFTGSLAGDVTGTQGATAVALVGGKSAASVATSVNDTQAATNLNTVSTIVKRDASGNFVAGTITASLTGHASLDAALTGATFTGSISATNLSGTNTGDLTLTAVGAAPNANAASLSGQILQLQPANTSFPGVLTAADWNTFNNKLDKSSANYITNSDAEVNTTGWNLYNDSPNPAFATVVAQDITYTAVAAGDAGNGINIDYIFHATQSYLTPLVTVLSPTHVTVAWYNGPTVLNNPTATQLKAAWDAVPGAVALATAAITGTAGKLQYETGANITANGGDTSPVDGTGGSVTGVTFTRSLVTPLVGTASFLLSKDAANREGEGVSTDFAINAVDKGHLLQINFAYQGSAGMVLGSSSDVRVFIYDVTNATLIPVKSTGASLAGPTGVAKTFSGQFQSVSTSVNYRLILHIATTSTTAWSLQLDSVVVTGTLNATAATQVPAVVLPSQPINGSVTDHMVVMWLDGGSTWIPATITGTTVTDVTSLLGFATNIVGLVADIVVAGQLDGFSFGPFVGFNQYIDNVSGGLSPLPSPFHDNYVSVGKPISSTILDIEFIRHVDQVGVKGGLLTNTGANDGTGDVVLTVGANGTFLVANSAASRGINWRTILAGDVPTLNQNTTGSAAKLTTARTIAGNSFDGSANITFANKFIVQGTTDAGLSSAQFLGALGTGIVKNTTTTGVLSIAVAGDFPTLNQNTTGTAATFTGNLTGPVTSVGMATTVTANAITNAMLAQMPAHTFKGNNTGGTANALDLTIAQMVAELNPTLTSAILNLSSVTGTTVTDALNTINANLGEVYLSAIKNGGAVTANTEIASWTTVTKDTNGAFNATTGTFTVPVAGDYEVTFTAAETLGTPLAQVYWNGTLVQTGIGNLGRSAVTFFISNASVSDTIWVAMDTTGTLTSTTTDNTLNICKVVGPGTGPVNARFHSSATAITAALATITYTTSDFNTNAGSYAAGVYTIPSAGKYTVKASLSLTAATAAAGNNYDIIIRKNGTEIARNKFVVGAATQKPNTVVVEDLVSCATSDTIDIQASAAGTTPSINASTTLNYFYINKVSI